VVAVAAFIAVAALVVTTVLAVAAFIATAFVATALAAAFIATAFVAATFVATFALVTVAFVVLAAASAVVAWWFVLVEAGATPSVRSDTAGPCQRAAGAEREKPDREECRETLLHEGPFLVRFG
jgi:hypothetical protein